jgi:outer membrane receptor protein involved in Fe transport
LNLIDGIRFNNSIFRSGPNQYLAFIGPGQVRGIEAVLGPTGSQYGSDSLGGTINVLTSEPRFGSQPAFAPHGEFHLFGASADVSGGANAEISLASNRLAWLIGGAGRRHNDLRAGGGKDSRNIFRRFFGLSAEQNQTLVGNRQQDSGFTRHGYHTKLAARPSSDQTLTLWYQSSQLEGVRGYRNLLGGRGRLQASFEPQSLKFFYGRYQKLGLGGFDSVSGTFSVNSQRDGFVQQNERFTDKIVSDRNGVEVFGYSAQATSHLGTKQAIVFGGEVYDEHIDSSRFETDPVAKTIRQTRGLYPDGSRYASYGLFVEDTAELFDRRLRAVFGARFTGANLDMLADRDPFVGIDSSQSFSDVTFNSSLAWKLNDSLCLNFLVGRGFRVPNLNDLGAIGLQDLGYEIPASEAVPAGALIGSSSGEDAVSMGKQVSRLSAETLYNYEAGITAQAGGFYARIQVFDAEFLDPIVRRTLLFRTDRVPTTLSGLKVHPMPGTAAQQAQGVVPVATELDPLAVKAFVNDGHARYYGMESVVRCRLSSRWTVEGNYSLLVGRDLNPNRNVRRLPPQHGFLRLRHTPSGRRFWWEIAASFAGSQKRLSGGDLSDERIGASRSRSDIARVFHGGLVSPYVAVGGDGIRGTADDVFVPTGETRLQLQDRVLPIGATINTVRVLDDLSRVPLFLQTDGSLSVDVRGEIPLEERVNLYLGVSNVFDRNYRHHGSGLDAPGVNVFAGIGFVF